MAPKSIIPEEIDLFTGPHSRMKELVNIYTEKVQCVDFGDRQQLFQFLDELKYTLREFKSHESIENMFIMDQLKNRLKQRHIYNSAVCHCHNDNTITEMISLVMNGKYLKKTSIVERQHFGQKLQEKFSNFVKEFVPHMEEEENIFQPLLVEHFEYDELRILKEAVLEQHELIKDPQYFEKSSKETNEIDEAIKDCRDLDDWNLASFFENAECQTSSQTTTRQTFSLLPVEILVKIFKHLKPPDLGRCAQTCHSWNQAVYTTCLWRDIYPIQWSRGIWELEDQHLNLVLEDKADCAQKYDQDADVDESERLHEQTVFRGVTKYLLPRIGKGVRVFVMDGGYHIPNHLIRKALKECPNIVRLSAAYTQTSYESLKGVYLQSLKTLDLQGCFGVNDALLRAMLVSLERRPPAPRMAPCVKQSAQRPVSSIGYERAFYCPFTGVSCKMSDAPTAASGCAIQSKNKHKFCYCRDQWIGAPEHTDEKNQPNDLSTLHADIEECVDKKLVTASVQVPPEPTLEHLNLSGCHAIQGFGLLSLSNSGLLWNLKSLNLSGCFQMSSQLLHIVTLQCPSLTARELNYCDNIQNGPYATTANGCDSLSHPLKVCCRSGIVN